MGCRRGELLGFCAVRLDFGAAALLHALLCERAVQPAFTLFTATPIYDLAREGAAELTGLLGCRRGGLLRTARGRLGLVASEDWHAQKPHTAQGQQSPSRHSSLLPASAGQLEDNVHQLVVDLLLAACLDGAGGATL